jgi:hypothetical protein
VRQHFHVSDREEPATGHRDYDHLYKVKPILDHVTVSLLLNYNVGREVAVDEAMIRYTGKLSFH